ncbi:hypothetical protein H8K32_19500 [Undibacterium jejuense]|uniref:Histidine kinase n=1 Tax=Undibacterium jejuense TaxID=1344949 RepID=A0A923HRB5_9BURK|nr:histidine kinase [Undibacterium jejuense]MBC3864291.1 hypothetical protein [Undibacterium jejuense]
MHRLFTSITKSFARIQPSTIDLFRSIVLIACTFMLVSGIFTVLDMPAAEISNDATKNRYLSMLVIKVSAAVENEQGVSPQVEYRLFVMMFITLLIMFALAFWYRTHSRIHRSQWLNQALLALQIAIAILVQPWTDPGLQYLIAAELAFILPYKTALLWMCGQIFLLDACNFAHLSTLQIGAAQCNVAGVHAPPFAAMTALQWLKEMVFQGMVFCIGYFVHAEILSRATLAGTHAEIQATEAILTDTVRLSEQNRISQSLHDVIGDNLAALNIQLNLANQESEAHVKPSVRTAQTLAQSLLSEIQQVVGIEREHDIVDLRQTLHNLCARIPALTINLSLSDQFAKTSPAVAHAFFRCVQEALSNVIRHSGADTIHIRGTGDGGMLYLSVTDNGTLSSEKTTINHGNGLQGMRTRLENLSGTLDSSIVRGGGFRLTICLPKNGRKSC